MNARVPNPSPDGIVRPPPPPGPPQTSKTICPICGQPAANGGAFVQLSENSAMLLGLVAEHDREAPEDVIARLIAEDAEAIGVPGLADVHSRRRKRGWKKRRVLEAFDRDPTQTAADVAKLLGYNGSYVRGTLARNGRVVQRPEHSR